MLLCHRSSPDIFLYNLNLFPTGISESPTVLCQCVSLGANTAWESDSGDLMNLVSEAAYINVS